MKRIDDEVAGKHDQRIHKQDWRPRSDLEYELGARNVIYMLLDSTAKRFYVGEAADLVARLSANHPSIPHWDYFRYDVLPSALASFRVALERMLIRDFASVLKNSAGVQCLQIDGCTLCNTKVDR